MRKYWDFKRIKDPRSTKVGWIRCLTCGKIIQASGIGIGAHRRYHARRGDAMVWKDTG